MGNLKCIKGMGMMELVVGMAMFGGLIVVTTSFISKKTNLMKEKSALGSILFSQATDMKILKSDLTKANSVSASNTSLKISFTRYANSQIYEKDVTYNITPCPKYGGLVSFANFNCLLRFDLEKNTSSVMASFIDVKWCYTDLNTSNCKDVLLHPQLSSNPRRIIFQYIKANNSIIRRLENNEVVDFGQMPKKYLVIPLENIIDLGEGNISSKIGPVFL
jgi:hypothetical protein